MELKIANQSDSEKLIDFYKQFSIHLPVSLQPERYSDFFSSYKCHGSDYRTYILKDNNEKIYATANFSIRKTFIEGFKESKIAVASDLRVANNRKAIIEWSNHFLPVIEEIKKDFQVEQIFSYINTYDPGALNTFIRPRSMKRPLPRYYLYRKINLISLHGKLPWAPRPLSGLRIVSGNKSNLDALMAYILKRSQYKYFADVGSLVSFQEKLNRLVGLQLEDFLIAFDKNENVVGCLAPWNSKKIYNFIPLKYNLQAHNFRQALKFMWLLGWTRRLTKPVSRTNLEAPLDFSYLTFLFVDNEDIFESLLWEAYQNTAPNNFLVYTQVERDFRIAPPRTWISAQNPFALYVVVPPMSEMPHFLDPSLSLNPEVEPFFVL